MSPRSSDLPAAASGHAPEPWWAEHRLTQDRSAVRARATAPEAAAASTADHGDSAGPLWGLGVAALRAAYAARRVEPPEMLGVLRARIAAHPSGPQAVLGLIAGADEDAAESARRWRDGAARPLEGIPFGVKDIIDVAGARVTCGSLQTGERVAAADATVVARLRAQGAIPFAMLATTEFACGSAHNARYGFVGNPWDRARWTGGSSTGSGAALAARLLPLALGSDTGGSIRVPSAWCGTTGLKPTRGLVPRTGVATLSWTLDHVGPMARSARDLALVMPWIAGPDGADGLAGGRFDAGWVDAGGFDAGGCEPGGARGLAGLRIGVPGGWFLDMQDDAVLTAWRAALAVMESAGAVLVPIDLGELRTAPDDGYTVLFAELASMQEPDFGRSDQFDAGTRGRIEQGRATLAIDYLRALRRRPLVQRQLLAAMDAVDVLVTPGVGGEAGFLDDLTVDVNGTRHPFHQVIPRNTMIFDYTGQPALMLPSGRGRGGLPVAIQIVGKLFDDALCLAVGAAFQRLTGHHLAAPPEPA